MKTKQQLIAEFTATIDELMDLDNRTDAQEFNLRLTCDLRAQLLAQL